MIRKLFNFGKKKGQEQQEEAVIWKSAKTEQTDRHEQEEPEKTHLFNLPVKPEAIPGNGAVITVQCAKHGDGATTVATNLAAALARGNPDKVVLVDVDGYGSIRSRMGLPASECLVNILDWEDVRGARDMARAMVTHSSGVIVVPGVIHFDHIPKVKPDLIFKMLTVLKSNFDVIILDCPPVGNNNNTWAAALVSDAILTVMRPDRTSLDLYPENSSYMARLGCGSRMFTVLNQAGVPGGIRPADLVDNKQLGITINAVLPYSVGVSEENNRRRLIVNSKPRDPFSQAVRALAEELSN